MNSFIALRARPGWVGRVVRLFSSIWLGVSLLALIILYSSVGSAVPVFRQYFELTEFEYFNHWFFIVLIALFCINLTTATVVRIRFNKLNLGVLTVHTGLLLLAGGSVMYFGRKIEGDVLLYNPRVVAVSTARVNSGDANAAVGQVVAAKGRSWEANMPGLGGRYRIEVDDVRHNGLRTAAEVKLRVESPDDPSGRTITLQQDSPHGPFAVLNKDIVLRLAPTNVVDRFFDSNTPVLLVRRGGSAAVELPLEGLPYYHERFVPGVETIADTRGRPVASARLDRIPGVDRWQMPLPVGDGQDLSDWPFRLEIDGYLPYASLHDAPVAGGTELNPIATIEASIGGERRSETLSALRPRASRWSIPDHLAVEFRWLEAGEKVPEEWMRPVQGRHVLDVWVKDRDVRRQLDVSRGQTIKIDGTDYELTIEDLQADWPLATAGFEQARTPVARVLVKTPKQSYHRSVLQRYPQLNQDRDDDGKKMSDQGLVDPNLELRYTDASVPSVVIAAGPDLAPVAVCTAAGGKRTMQVVRPDEPITLGDDVEITLRSFIERPKFVQHPVVIPREQRRPQPGRQMSLIRLHVIGRNSDWEERVWVPFESYNDMFSEAAPHWASVVVPGIGQVEFMYGRLPRLLPGSVALEQMHVDFYPGRNRPSEWISYIRFEDPRSGQIHAGKAYLNNTARIGPWTLFQSGEAPDHESFTILGVGNRDGVWTMLMGCTLVTLGLLYAFYVKPGLKRRMREQLAAQAHTEAPLPAERDTRVLAPTATIVALLVLFAVSPARATPPADPPSDPAASLRDIQDKLELDPLRTLMVQHDSRYQTLEAWARDVVTSIHGKEKMLGLDPVVAAFELMFHRAAYDRTPVIYIKDLALRKHITSHPVQIQPAEAARIVQTGLVSFEFLSDPAVQSIIDQVGTRTIMRRAIDRYSIATSYYQSVLSLFRIIPSPTGRYDSPWVTIDKLLANVGAAGAHANLGVVEPVAGVDPATAMKILNSFRELGQAWQGRDAASINRAAAALGETIPGLAPPGTYPTLKQRRLEVVYHHLNALTTGWALYVAALFASVWAVISGFRWTRRFALGLYMLAFVFHGAGLAMRWYIVGRIPVANMFESVVASAWVGVAIALALELATGRGVFMLAGSFLGFLSLVLALLTPKPDRPRPSLYAQ